MRKILYTSTAEAHMKEWEGEDKKIYNKIIDLLDDTQKNPFSGLGKPEPLKYHLKGCWSRRINYTHRLIYQVTDDSIVVISCKFHYE